MRGLERFFRDLLLRGVGLFFTPTPLRPEEIDYSRIKRILVVRQHDQIGDLLIATPALRALRERFPQAYITVVVRQLTQEILINNPYIDEVLVYYRQLQHWSLSTFLTFIRRIRPYDLAVVLNTVSRSFSSDLIAWLSGAKYRLGSMYKKYGPGPGDLFYNLAVPVDTQNEKSQVDSNLDVVRYIGADTTDKSYILVLTEAEILQGQQMLQSLSIPPARWLIGVHLGARFENKRWPLDKYAHLCDALVELYGAKIILTRGPGEEKLVETLKEQVKNKESVFISPPTTLRTLAGLVRNFDLYIGNDTGALHIAASQKVPLIGLYGPSNPAQWKPIGDIYLAIRKENRKIDSISVEDVLAGVEVLLKNWSAETLPATTLFT